MYVRQDRLHYDILAEFGTVVNKSRLIRRSTVVMIILLYTLTTINFAFSWSYIHLAFIEHGQSFRTVYSRLTGPAQAFFWGNGITSAFGTILADLYIVCATRGISTSAHRQYSTLDMVLLDGLGTTLAFGSTFNAFPNFCNR